VGAAGVEPERLLAGIRHRESYLRAKRVLDVVVVLLIAVPALAVFLGSAMAIAVTMGSPILIVQNRVGLNGRVFRLFKLRTMTLQPKRSDFATLPNDPRVTVLGKLLRKTHLDEIPQLWNVLIGDMSLVGPRPEQAHLVAKYESIIPNYKLRHAIKPGLSGYAQVYYGYASDVSETYHKLSYDLFYVQHFGLLLDMKILVRTLGVYFDSNYVR
jgi:lipopolysaccharide/colanic/teichoic acid biosynthesis glycosyltransferase